MTKEKVVEGIEKIIEEQLGLVESITRDWMKFTEEKVDTVYFVDIAKKIKDSLVLDEEKIEKIIKKYKGYNLTTLVRIDLAKAIAKADTIIIKGE